MTILLLRLAGPMQSWGTRSRFTHRDTGLEPSRSGVIGLLCAALGRSRTAPLEDFVPLRMAVRVDREGRLLRDFQTAQNVCRADPTRGLQETVVSERFYLADADFLVGLEGQGAVLEQLASALRRPVWSLYLGRKSYVPALPLLEGVQEGPLLEVLKRWPRQERAQEPVPAQLRYVVEGEDSSTGETRADRPLSFASADRRFDVRHVRTEYHPFPALPEVAPCS